MEPWKFDTATDFGLSPRARLSSLRREEGLFGGIVHPAWSLLSRAYLKAAHRVRIVGREHLPKSASYVLVANHTSHLDAIVLSGCVPIRQCNRIFPIAAGDAFFDNLPASIFAALALNALPLWRRKVSTADLALLRARLGAGQTIYILFPEGTRARDGVLAPFKAGLGRLVAGTSIPVVPCYIDGAFDALSPQRRLPRLCRIVVTIGPPLLFTAFPDEKKGWLEIASATERAVRSLAGQAAGTS
jgi:1-acyl-sn-glycerol-3-phosphate acyltransferase